MSSVGGVDLYGASYRNFASALYAEIRREAFGEDIGQTGWLTAEEQDLFLAWLGLSPAARLLDVACGSGGPTLRIAEKTGAAWSASICTPRGSRAPRRARRNAAWRTAPSSMAAMPPRPCRSGTAASMP